MAGAAGAHELVLRVPLPDPRLAEAALRALKPEAEKPATGRFRAEVRLEGEVLVVHIEAKDTSALRAALNSFVSWIQALTDACLTLSRS